MTRSTNGIRFALLLIALAAVSSGCGRKLMPTPMIYVGTDPATFDMVPEERRSNVVAILYATDRLPVDQTTSKAPPAHRAPGLAYSAVRSGSLAFGVTRVRLGPEKMTWEELAEASVSAKRDLALKYVDVEEIVRTPRWPWFTSLATEPELTPEQSTAAMDESIAQLHELLAERLAVSQKKEVFVFGHAADYESSDFTVGHFKLVLKALASSDAVERIHILSHSRGAGVLSAALRELEIEYRNRGEDPAAVLKLGNAVFAAADLDMDVATQRVGGENAWDACERITVYAEAGAPRRSSPTRRSCTILFEDKLSMIYNPQKTGFIGHAYYVDNPHVSSDLILLLRDGALPGSEARPLERDPTGLWLMGPGYPHVTPEPVSAPAIE